MRTLLLVRHGQASIAGDDYDVLSARGLDQSRRLGRWLVDAGRRPHALVCGPRRRHLDSAHALITGGGGAWPAVVTLDGLDELPFRQIVLACLPEWATDDAELRATVERGDVRALQALFATGRLRAAVAHTVERWTAGALVGAFEPFVDFRARVRDALDRAAALADGQPMTVVVVTSGGPIGVAIERGTTAPPAQALGRGLNHHNAAFTELHPGERWQLGAEDAHPHLPSELLTRV